MSGDIRTTSYLAKPIRIGARTAKNRFCIQPMECCDADEHGTFSERTLRRYLDYGAGGAGIVVIEGTTLQYDSRSTKHQLLLDVNSHSNRVAWEQFIRRMKQQFPDTLFLVQLQHAGEVSSNEFSRRVSVKPHAGFGGQLIDAAYAEQVIRQSVEATGFLYEIGFDGVDLKFCHGYLGSQILRPYNDRTWKYGGSWENRSRFAFEQCEKIRQLIPDHRFLVGAKVSVYEGIPGGQGHAGPDAMKLDMTEPIALCQGLEQRGADYIIESLGTGCLSWELMAPNPANEETVCLHLAAAKLLRDHLKPETVVIGSGLSLLQGKAATICEQSIQQGIFDAAAYGRQALADPYLPQKYLQGRLQDVSWCECCDGCGALLRRQEHTYCVRT